MGRGRGIMLWLLGRWIDVGEWVVEREGGWVGGGGKRWKDLVI